MTTRTITVEALAAALKDAGPFPDRMPTKERAAAIFAALPPEPAGAGLREALEEVLAWAPSLTSPGYRNAAAKARAALAATPEEEHG